MGLLQVRSGRGAERGIRFGRYRFHRTQGLTRGRQEVRLTPKSLAVLGVLLARAGEVVTREELFRAVWLDMAVSEAALTTCIQELRRALADDARHPKYIETLHRRGFRFVAATSAEDDSPIDQPPNHSRSGPGPLVGRDAALNQLCDSLTLAREGRRQVVFVTGEPGIGKTALVDTLLATSIDPGQWRVARAECIEHHGAGEAYQPLLEALTRLCTQADSEACLTALRECAPSWLAQLPALQTQSERQASTRRSGDATPERMLRELTDAVETMTRRSSLVLCLEDLHWSDASTLEWIASFARRPEPASVLVIGTYRPGEAINRPRSPEAAANDLSVKGLCRELALTRLDADAVRLYVMTHFPPAEGAGAAIDELATLVSRRTEGNPLFVVNVLTSLAARNVLMMRDGRWAVSETLDAESLAVPTDIRRAIEWQFDRLSGNERRLLEVASVTGVTCSAAAVAAGAGTSATDVEETFDALARRNAFVREGPPIEWPDGTVSATFEFLHSLYREVLNARLSPGRRVELHRAIGARLEAAYGSRATEVSAELAVHFEQGRDLRRAVVYLEHAAETDRSRSAHDLAQRHYRRALALLDTLPASDERDEREVALRIGLGNVLMQTSGWGAGEVEAMYARVRELAEARSPAQPLVSALWNLWIFYTARARLDEAVAYADRLFTLAEQSGNAETLLQAHHARWSTLFTLGDLHGTELHAREGLRLHEEITCPTLAYGSHDTGICARLFCARALAHRGEARAAAALCDDATTIARQIDHPFTLAFAMMHAAAVYQSLGEAAASQVHAAEGQQIAREHNLSLMFGWATCFLGWSMTHLGEARRGMTVVAEGVAAARATGSELFQPHMLGLLASAQAANGLFTDALDTIREALAIGDRTGERFYAAELHRIQGELRLECGSSEDARRLAAADFATAMRIADAQGAQLFAQRAARNLARAHDGMITSRTGSN